MARPNTEPMTIEVKWTDNDNKPKLFIASGDDAYVAAISVVMACVVDQNDSEPVATKIDSVNGNSDITAEMISEVYTTILKKIIGG